MKKLSIGLRLTLSYVAIFALGELVFGVGMWFVLQNNLYNLVDGTLERQVEDLKNFLLAQKKDASLAQLQEQVTATYSIEHSGDYLEIYLETGDPIYRSAFLQANPRILLPPTQIKHPLYRSRHVGDQHFRFAFQHLTANGHVYTVEMGIPADDAVETLLMFRSYMLMFAPFLLLVSAGVGYGMSRRALAPVEAQVHTKNATQLTPAPGSNTSTDTV